MAEPGDPVLEQPKTKEQDVVEEGEQVQEVQDEEEGKVVESSNSWWGVNSFTSILQQPHLLEQGITSLASQVAQATSGATKMVKSKSMEVMKVVQEDLGEVKSSLASATAPMAPAVKGAGGALLKNIKEFDEVTDEMAEAAITGVTKSASSFWNMASGYATQMFIEDDLEATPVLVGSNMEPIILDRVQAQLHALASDPTTYSKDPESADCLSEAWTSYLASMDLDSRQGEISELMINNQHIRKHYSDMVPICVQHKLFWARYFFKVHLIEQQEQKRAALKARAEQTKVESDSEINWDDDDDEEDVKSGDISECVQEKLLSDYEAELKTSSTTTKLTHAKKDSNASDDWEKLSNGSK